MINSIPPEERLDVKKKTHKIMMWLGIASIVMMFIGLSSGYVVAKADITWVHIEMPPEFYISAIIILISSVTYWMALRFAKKSNFKMSTILVLITLFLGFGFVKYQWEGWQYLHSKGLYFVDAENLKALVNNEGGEYGKDFWIVDKGVELKYVDGKFYDARDDYNSKEVNPGLDAKNNASSFLFLLTGLHIAHLLGGIISLIVVSIKSLRKKYSTEDIVGIEVSSLYWHFLDFLWLYLLGLLYFVG